MFDNADIHIWRTRESLFRARVRLGYPELTIYTEPQDVPQLVFSDVVAVLAGQHANAFDKYRELGLMVLHAKQEGDFLIVYISNEDGAVLPSSEPPDMVPGLVVDHPVVSVPSSSSNNA